MMCEPKLIEPGISMWWQIMSGAPCLTGTAITPQVLMGMFLHGQSVRKIASDYGIKEAQVEDALRYEYNLKASGKRRPRQRRPKD
jgi:uncharacterized protein (DUF433 family)